MYGLVGCLLGFVLIVLIFLIVFSIVVAKKVKDAFSFLNPKSRKQPNAQNADQNVRFTGGQEPTKKKQKVFDDDEGEYVDYEEID